jgi:GNAT superfamily N-acetyltransferase
MEIKVFKNDDPNVLRGLLDGVEEFINESFYQIEFDRERSSMVLMAYAESPAGEVIYMANDEGKPVAAVLVAAEADFMTEPFGYIVKFYVRPEARRSGVARELLGAATEWFKVQGTAANFATATAGIGKDKIFVNLFKKFGYTELGPTLIQKG